MVQGNSNTKLKINRLWHFSPK